MAKPNPSDYSLFSSHYIMSVPEDDLQEALKNQWPILEAFLDTIPEAKADYAYAPGKWTIKQLVQHMTDTERIFAHRALWIVRKASSPLTSFDENEFAKAADVSRVSLKELIEEFKAVRKSTEFLYSKLTEEELNAKGKVNDHMLSVKSTGFIIVGHFIHHKRILEERYL